MSKRKIFPEKVYHSAQYNDLKVTSVFDQTGRLDRVDVETLPQPVSEVERIASIIDHTLLKLDATEDQVIQLCQEAETYHFGAVCVNSCWVPICVSQLADIPVKVGAVVGFPWGTPSTESKVAETKAAVNAGANEVDMVINIGKLKSRDYAYVANDINRVVQAAHKSGVIVKVILETCLLTEEEKIIACLLSKQAGADFVKTSTGYAAEGATEENIRLMRSVVGEDIGVKASGGVRSYADVKKMLAAGASRIGSSSGIKILQEIAGEVSAAQQNANPGY